VLHGSVDAKELRVAAADPQDEALAVHGDLEVVIRDPAAERLERQVTVGPDAGSDLLRSHRAILRRVTIRLVEHPDSVVIVAVERDQLVCVRQTRPGSAGVTLELPSGKLEPGETAIEAATRELAEECALGADEWQELGAFLAVPAYSTEFVHVYAAAGLWAAAGSVLDDDEDVEVKRIPLVGSLGRLSDAVSVAALALWLEGR
jgi:ADP-ribose pyrophosphatase